MLGRMANEFGTTAGTTEHWRRNQRLETVLTLSLLVIVLLMAIASLEKASVPSWDVAAVVLTWSGTTIFSLRSLRASSSLSGEEEFVNAEISFRYDNSAHQCTHCRRPLDNSVDAQTERSEVSSSCDSSAQGAEIREGRHRSPYELSAQGASRQR
jgi:hypothetical protein